MEVIGKMHEGDAEIDDVFNDEVVEYQGVKHSRSDIIQWFR